MDGDTSLHGIQRAQVFEWNLNTIVGLATLIGVAVSGATGLMVGGYQLNDVRRDIKAEKDRNDASDTTMQSINQAIGAINDHINASDDRLTAAETRNISIDAASDRQRDILDKLVAEVNQQNTNVEVLRSWIEDQRRMAGHSPPPPLVTNTQ